MKQVDALQAIADAGGTVWLGMMYRGRYSGVTAGTTPIPARVWERLLERGDLDAATAAFDSPSNDRYLVLTDQGRERLGTKDSAPPVR